eukprot:15057715-Alexandrium_andersonii.AAC.1
MPVLETRVELRGVPSRRFPTSQLPEVHWLILEAHVRMEVQARRRVAVGLQAELGAPTPIRDLQVLA